MSAGKVAPAVCRIPAVGVAVAVDLFFCRLVMGNNNRVGESWRRSDYRSNRRDRYP
ncbi:hypothetical protein ACQY1H_25280 (plasmid) [Agrobacterium vitis]|uniref:hypothetical protein n=1 Tax=Agrobacterium vitis TaxID=373 RepID=UPI003D297A23